MEVKQAQALANPGFQRAAYEPLGGKPLPGEKARDLVFMPFRGIPGNQDAAQPLAVLMGMVGLILVIACSNLAMLLMARNTSRQREFSVRLAIGGTRLRLFGQLLAESLLLGAAGSALGCVLATPAARALAAWAGLETNFAPDVRVLAFATGISLVAVLIFGVAPLFAAVRVPLGLALKGSAANLSQGRGRLRLGKIIVGLQVALCLVLVTGSGLLVRSLRNLEHVRLGMRTEGLVVFGISPEPLTHRHQEVIRLHQALLERLQTTPGVESVTLMQNRIGSGWSNNTNATVDGKIVPGSHMRWNAVGPKYFATLGVPLLQGREFDGRDSDIAPKVAVINQTLAKRFFAGRNALGHQVSFSTAPIYQFTVVGVVSNSKYEGVREEELAMAYFPYTQSPGVGLMHFEVRTAGDPRRFIAAIRKAVSGYAPDLVPLQPMTQQAQFDSTILGERLLARLSLCFGGLAILLVVSGIYGTLAYHVGRRTSEIGIRMALGAARPQVLWMVLRESLAVCLIALGAGLPLTMIATKLLRSLLFGLSPTDPLTVSAASAGILAVGLVASLLPALRAASVEPTRALRYE